MAAITHGSTIEHGVKQDVIDAIPALAAIQKTCILQRVEIIMCNKSAMVLVVTGIPKSYPIEAESFTSAIGGGK